MPTDEEIQSAVRKTKAIMEAIFASADDNDATDSDIISACANVISRVHSCYPEQRDEIVKNNLQQMIDETRASPRYQKKFFGAGTA